MVLSEGKEKAALMRGFAQKQGVTSLVKSETEKGMYYIAICDDEEYTCSEIEMCILEYTRKCNLEIDIDVYYSGEEFQRALQGKAVHYDILFLDIELITMTGMDIARMIRDEMDNEAMQIIYISSKQQYAMELFKTRPMDFLLKPLDKEAVVNDFIQAVRLIDREQQVFEFHVGHRVLKKYYKDILFFQSNNKIIEIFLENEMMQFYGKMDDVAAQLKSADFLRIHKSYLVNAIHIMEYTYEWIKMKNGMILPISKANRVNIRQELLARRCKKHNEYRVCD